VNFSVSGPLGAASPMSVQATPSSVATHYNASQAWDSSSVADGSYTLKVIISDSQGSVTSLERSYRIQNAAPSSPTHLTADSKDAGVILNWQQPAVARAKLYRLLRDGADLTLPFGGLAPDERSFI